MTIKELARWIRRVNEEHGFESRVGNNPAIFSEKMLLIVSEICEALEEYRDGRDINAVYFTNDKPDKPEGIPVELADVAIRLFDFVEANGIDLEQEIIRKVRYNETRPHKHGKAF